MFSGVVKDKYIHTYILVSSPKVIGLKFLNSLCFQHLGLKFLNSLCFQHFHRISSLQMNSQKISPNDKARVCFTEQYNIPYFAHNTFVKL